VPYQLHCDVPAQVELELELTTELTELFDELELVAGVELFDELELVAGTELELGTELFELDAEVVATELLVTVEQTAPVIVGISAAAVLFLSPWTPKLTDWPG
jgi:hypothetical protein